MRSLPRLTAAALAVLGATAAMATTATAADAAARPASCVLFHDLFLQDGVLYTEAEATCGGGLSMNVYRNGHLVAALFSGAGEIFYSHTCVGDKPTDWATSFDAMTAPCG